MSEKLSFKQRRQIKKIKKLKDKIDKQTEEMKKMAKMVLKDGKIQPAEMPPNVTPNMDVPPEPPMLQPQFQQPQFQQPQFQQPQFQQPQFQPQQQYEEEYPIPQQQIPPQQFVRQPVIQPVQQQQPIIVTIKMYDGEVIEVAVQSNQIDDMLRTLSEAIDNQTTFQVGTRVLNGRYILYYNF